MRKHVPLSPQVEQHLEYCRKVVEDMVRSGTWPWKRDSTLSEDLLESEDIETDV